MRVYLRKEVELFVLYTADDPNVPPIIEEVMIDDIPVKLGRSSGLSERIREIAQEDADEQLAPKPTEEEMRNYQRSR